MRKKRILSVVKDPGGMAAVLPVVDMLNKDGHEVILVANGKAVELLSTQDRRHIARTDAETLLNEVGVPDLLLTSMCTDGGVGRDLVRLLHGRVPTVAVQDQWGAWLLTIWGDLYHRPDYIIVGDKVARDLVLRAWTHFPPQRAVITGYAALDTLADSDVCAACARVRKNLDIDDAVRLFYYSGQASTGTAQGLQEFLEALNILSASGFPVAVVAAKHPRAGDSDNSEVRVWQKALDKHSHLLREPKGNAKISQLEYIAAADVTVSAFSTALLTASAMRKPAISVMWPGSSMLAAYQVINEGLLDEHPLVTMKAVAGPRNFEDLVEICKNAATGQLASELLPRQIESVQVGGSAEKVARFVSNL